MLSLIFETRIGRGEAFVFQDFKSKELLIDSNRFLFTYDRVQPPLTACNLTENIFFILTFAEGGKLRIITFALLIEY